jgi:hypothetical protein
MISFHGLQAKLLRMLLLMIALLAIHGIFTRGVLFAAAAPWGPVLGKVTPTSAEISWLPGNPAVKNLRFQGKIVTASLEGEDCRVALTGLAPDTEYSYTFPTGHAGKTYRFRTAPAEPTAFTFAVYGDSRSGHDVHRKIIAALLKLQPRFVINTGDLVASGAKASDWQQFFAIAAPLTGSTPYLAAPGNHEGNADYFFRLFPPPGDDAFGNDAYSWAYGGVRVIVLNSTRNIAAQRDWLDRYLTNHAGEARWTVAAFHHPPFSSSDRGGTASMRDEWVPVLQRHRVDVVFLGHDHFYERNVFAGTPYLITGGGGAPLYSPNRKPNPQQQYAERSYHYLRVNVSPTTLRISMIRLNGSVGDEVVLAKPLEVEDKAGAR